MHGKLRCYTNTGNGISAVFAGLPDGPSCNSDVMAINTMIAGCTGIAGDLICDPHTDDFGVRYFRIKSIGGTCPDTTIEAGVFEYTSGVSTVDVKCGGAGYLRIDDDCVTSIDLINAIITAAGAADGSFAGCEITTPTTSPTSSTTATSTQTTTLAEGRFECVSYSSQYYFAVKSGFSANQQIRVLNELMVRLVYLAYFMCLFSV